MWKWIDSFQWFQEWPDSFRWFPEWPDSFRWLSKWPDSFKWFPEWLDSFRGLPKWPDTFRGFQEWLDSFQRWARKRKRRVKNAFQPHSPFSWYACPVALPTSDSFRWFPEWPDAFGWLPEWIDSFRWFPEWVFMVKITFFWPTFYHVLTINRSKFWSNILFFSLFGQSWWRRFRGALM